LSKPSQLPESGRADTGRDLPSLASGASAALLSGIGAGLVAALLDTRQAWAEVDGASSLALVLLQTAARLAVTGAVLGLGVWLVATLGAIAARRLGRKPRTGAIAAAMILSAPALCYVAWRLFQGGFTSQLPARPVLVGATAAFLIVATGIAARIWLGLLERADRAERLRPWIVVAAVLLVTAALGARWADAHLYRRLYLFLHGALAVLTLGGLVLALRAAVLRAPVRTDRPWRLVRAAGIGLGVSLLLLVPARLTIDDRQVVKLAVYERTATTANVLRLTSGPRAIGSGPRPSADTRRERYERELRARAAASGEFPALPGAHLILISIDALRADRVGTYGYRERDLTPQIDAWAARSAVFERAYCPAPHSSYSIASMHASRFLHDEAAQGRDPTHPTMAQVLRGEGYETTAFYTQGIFFTEGEAVSHYKKVRFGFDDAHHGAPRPDKLTDYAIAELDRFVAREEPPVFMWVHYFNVHEPYRSTRFGNAPRDRYEGEIAETDPEVARLLEYIDEKLVRPAVVILTADHGEEFKDHGGHYHGSSLYEEQIRVPLIVSVPGAEPRRVSHPVSTVDLAPTALKLIGVEPPPSMIGHDLRPAIFGGDEAHVPTPVFASVMRQHMTLRWPWKLITDPSRGLYQLFDLEQDPREKVNRYDKQQELAGELLGEINAWLDEIGQGEDPARTAINLGRLRDPRAVPGLFAVALNNGAPSEDRVEALKLLGWIRVYKRTAEIVPLLDDPDEQVSTAAALALGEMGNDAGQELLRDALYDDDPDIRDRAARALGELGDKAAVPVLIEALGRDDLKVREHAIRLLGRLGDPQATEPLIETLAEDRTRYLSVLALGKLNDRRAVDPLLEVLDHETHTDIRGYVVVSFGWLRFSEVIPRVLRVLVEEPELRWTPEALVRLEAVGRAPLFGTDVARGEPALVNGWGKCSERPWIEHNDYVGRTQCKTTGPSATLAFEAEAPSGAILILRARHLLADKGQEAELAIRVDGEEVGRAELSGSHAETRIDTPGDVWKGGRHRVVLELDRPGRFQVDHLLVMAR